MASKSGSKRRNFSRSDDEPITLVEIKKEIQHHREEIKRVKHEYEAKQEQLRLAYWKALQEFGYTEEQNEDEDEAEEETEEAKVPAQQKTPPRRR